MEIIYSSSDEINSNEDMMINVFYNLFNEDFRQGFFSDESSLYDMKYSGFNKNNYQEVANIYYNLVPNNLDYVDSQKFYIKIIDKVWKNFIFNKFMDIYGIDLKEKHLLIDIIKSLKEKYPQRHWERENIFIIRTLDNLLNKQAKVNYPISSSQLNVIELNIRKKPTKEEILQGTNPFLIMKELNISLNEARSIAQNNYRKKMQGKVFKPYIPEDE